MLYHYSHLQFYPPTPTYHTGIANTGASGVYFAPNAPVAAPSVGVQVANGPPGWSVACATLASAPSLPPAAMQGHVMPSFSHTLIGLGPFADPGCRIVLTKTAVSVIHPNEHSILEQFPEQDRPRLWQFPLPATKSSCRCQRCVKNMRNRAHAEALPIFPGITHQPHSETV